VSFKVYGDQRKNFEYLSFGVNMTERKWGQYKIKQISQVLYNYKKTLLNKSPHIGTEISRMTDGARAAQLNAKPSSEHSWRARKQEPRTRDIR
jgi:hypothetical protein